MLPSIKRRLAALGPAAIPFADTTPGMWLLETSPAPAAPASSTQALQVAPCCPDCGGLRLDHAEAGTACRCAGFSGRRLPGPPRGSGDGEDATGT